MGVLERGLIIWITAALLVPLSALRSADVSVSRGAAPEDDRPNVIVLVTDDQPKKGTMDVMPVTKRLFQEGGTTFSHAFATTPQCCPARASIFTGQYAHNHRVLNNTEGWATELDHDTTLQHHLNQAGYRTGIFGKYLNHWDIAVPPAHFDEWAIFSRDDAEETGYNDVPFNVNGKIERVAQYSTDFLSDQAVDFVSGAADANEPFFLYLSPWAPHAPAIPEPRYRRAPVPEFETNPAIENGPRGEHDFIKDMAVPANWPPKFHDRQLRTLMSVDDMVKQLFKTLESLGEENTIAFFISDNGYTWGEHGMLDKTVPFLPSIQVPMMMRWPGHIDEGKIDDRLAANIDIAPTVLEATGGAPQFLEGMNGRSLFDEWDRDRLLVEYWNKEDHPIPTWTSILTKEFQYIEYYDPDGKDPIVRSFYNLVDDPYQVSDLLADDDYSNDPDVSFLSKQLADDAVCVTTACP